MNSIKMQMAALHAPRDLRVGETVVPTIQSGELLLQVKVAFLCGTDLRIYQNGLPQGVEATSLILGHEGSGVIAAVGEQLNGLTPGMRVAVAPNIGCGTCDLCVSGEDHLCSHIKALGIHLPGFFAEYVRIPEDFIRRGNVVEIPPALSFEEAALAEPLACVLNAFEKGKLCPGETVLIIGAGPIGLMHAKLAQAAGAAQIIINDLSQERLHRSAQLDPAFHTIGSEVLADEIDRLTNGRGADLCIAACSAPQAQQTALELAAINARVIFFGGLPPDRAQVPLDTNLIHYKQVTVTGTTRQSLRQYRRSLQLLASGRIIVKDLISSRTHLAEIHSALDQVAQTNALKSAICFE